MLWDLPGLEERVYGPLGSFYDRKPETPLLQESTLPWGESARLGATPPEVIHGLLQKSSSVWTELTNIKVWPLIMLSSSGARSTSPIWEQLPAQPSPCSYCCMSALGDTKHFGAEKLMMPRAPCTVWSLARSLVCRQWQMYTEVKPTPSKTAFL